MTRIRPKRPRRGPLWPILLMAVGGILIIGAIGWTIYSVTQPVPTAQPQAVSAADDSPNVIRVSVADSKAAYEASLAVFLDVRDAGSYAESHIPGAIHIPLAELPQRLGELNNQDWIIIYCT